MGEEVKNEEEQSVNNHTFPLKRKLDEEEDVLISSDSAPKKPKPEALLETKLIEEEEQHIEDEEAEEEEETEEEEYEDEDEDDEEEDEDEEHSNGEAEIDVKGKGIMKEDKGKGKLIEESEDDDSSDDDDADAAAHVFASDDDSDLSEDPLAEVDLDNILPSRTRSRRGPSRPGVVIGNNDDKDNGDE